MLRLIGIVVSIGLADSINPSTLAPALLLAAGEQGSHDVSHFMAGVFTVNFVGGALIVLGPGELVLDLAQRPSHEVSHIIEVVAGVVLLVVAGVLWRHRTRFAEKQPLAGRTSGGSKWLLGAGIALFEFPTAFPYFAAIAAVVGSNQSIPNEILLVALYTACFVAPMLAILATLTLAGRHAQQYLERARGVMQRHWPLVLALLALVAGTFTITLGLTGLAVGMHNDTGTLARKLRSILPH